MGRAGSRWQGCGDDGANEIRGSIEGVCVGMTPVDVARVSGRGLVAAEHKWGRLRWKGVDRVGTKMVGGVWVL